MSKFLWALLIVTLPAAAYSQSADFDGNGRIDLDDFFLFVDAFGGAESRFDLNGNGQVNLDDFLLFVDDFGTQTTEPNQPLPAAVIDITDALFTNRSADCRQYVNDYSSQVTDLGRNLSFSGELSIIIDDDTCLIAANAIPNHDFNQTDSFATPTSPQEVTYQITATPAPADAPTELAMGSNAVFLNGVKLDLLAAACYGVGNEPLGREKIGCGPEQLGNPWRYDPITTATQRQCSPAIAPPPAPRRR